MSVPTRYTVTPRHTATLISIVLLLACLMSQYCFARWSLSSVVVVVCRRRLSSSVTLPAGGPAAGRVGGRVADIAQRASTVTSRYGDTLLLSIMSEILLLVEVVQTYIISS